MTRAEFDAEFDVLLLAISPRGWEEERTEVYWRFLQGWGADEFRRVTNWLVTRRDRAQGMTAFPQIHEFNAARLRMDAQDAERTRAARTQRGTSELVSCAHCIGGRIWFEAKRGTRKQAVRDGNRRVIRGKFETVPNIYERYAACDCDSGTVVAVELVRVAHRARRTATVADVRYSRIQKDVGGIMTATAGQGVMLSPPPTAVPRETIRAMAGPPEPEAAPTKPQPVVTEAPVDDTDASADDWDDLPF